MGLAELLKGVTGQWRTVEGNAKFLDAVEGPGSANAYKKALERERSMLRLGNRTGQIKDGSLRKVATVPLSICQSWERNHSGCLHDKKFLDRVVKPTWGVLPMNSRRLFLGVDCPPNSRPSISTG